LHWAEKSLSVALAIGNIGATRSAAAIGSLACLEIGDTGPSARYLDLLEQGPTGNLEPLSTAVIIEALIAADSLTQAEQHAEAASATAGGRLRELVAVLALADVRLRSGAEHVAEAQEGYERARRLAGDLGIQSIEARAMLGLGELALARSDTAAAGRLFGDAAAIHRRLGLGYYATRAERLLAACNPDVQQSA
jgi:hypothetical protein